MTIPNVAGAAAAVSPEVAQGAVTSSVLAAPAVTATDTGNASAQIVATVTEPPAANPVEQVTPDAIERARQQEKDKLHTQLQQRDTRLQSMEEELKVLREEREARIAAEAEAQKTREEAERAKALAETSAKDLVLKQQQEWEQKFSQLQAEREAERATLAKEAEYNQLRAYIQEQVRLSSDDIAPQLLDLITGNTPEEVDQSIATMKGKTAEILDQVRAAQTQQRSQMRGVSPTSIPGASADELSGGTRQLSAQQLKDMPLSEYAKYRPQLGVTGNSTSNRGLFG